MIEIHALTTIGEIEPGADLISVLAGALAAAGLSELRPGDVLVVTQKIVSKAENRFVSLTQVKPGAEAIKLALVTGKDPRLVELVLVESVAVIRAAPNVLITRHRRGFVMANAGIDRSNTGPGEDLALLLPLDPDASAEKIRRGLAIRCHRDLGVVVMDSFGRPWRQGVVGVAIGASGLPSLIDRRGERDRNGRVLEVTQVALADAVAAAAGLATGEGAEGIPAALIRGLVWDHTAVPASALIRPPGEDLFQ